MIRSVSMDCLRGVRSGALEGLEALTLLAGPNGCGKSTVLDALLIGTSDAPAEAVARSVRRHPPTFHGARWLVLRGAGMASITVAGADDERAHTCYLCWIPGAGEETPPGPPPYSEVQYLIDPESVPAARTFFASDNSYLASPGAYKFELPFAGGVRPGSGRPGGVPLVDPTAPGALDQVYSDAVREGRKRQTTELLTEAVPGVEGLEILTEEGGSAGLYVIYPDRAVPASLAGNGVRGFLRLVLELAASSGGLVLVEGAELFQHPRTLTLTARALLAAARRGVQVVATVHGLELVDAIVEEAGESDLELLALFDLRLADGELLARRFRAAEIASARETLSF